MKTPLFLAALIACSVSPAFAAKAPALMKAYGNGHVSPDFRRHSSCTVYSDRVVIQKTLGFSNGAPIQLTQTIPVKLNAEFSRAMSTASGEPVEQKPNPICDLPGTSLYAQVTESGPAFAIDSTGGCGSPAVKRIGRAAQALREISDAYCGDIGAAAPSKSTEPSEPTRPSGN